MSDFHIANAKIAFQIGARNNNSESVFTVAIPGVLDRCGDSSLSPSWSSIQSFEFDGAIYHREFLMIAIYTALKPGPEQALKINTLYLVTVIRCY